MNRVMTLDQFLVWLFVWYAAWQQAYDAGEPGFGDESTLEDWLGSLDAFARLQALATMKGK